MMASYDVDEILDSRKKGKNVEYLVRWAPTWESEKNLNCKDLLKEFKASNQKNGNNDTDDAEDDDDVDDKANTSRGRPTRKAPAKRKAAPKSAAKRTKRRR